MMISILDRIVPKRQRQIVYYTFPDLADNGFAFFIFVANTQPCFTNIWIVDNFCKRKLYSRMIANYSNSHKHIFVKKNSLRALFYYLESKFVFITHNLYKGAKISKDHYVVNLWHGMPFKRIGKLDGKEISRMQKQKFLTVTSKYFQEVFNRCFDTTLDSILITGQPRTDLLFQRRNGLNTLQINRAAYDRIIIWMPTYRRSNIGEIRYDGRKTSALPVVNEDELILFNGFLKTHNVLCLVKLHPMDSTNESNLHNLSNIVVLNNALLENNGVQLYSILGECDVLMTDYSSVIQDFMLLRRPIILLADDITAYEESRGFIEKDIRGFMPVRFTETYEDLIRTLEKIIVNRDICQYRNERLFNEVHGNFSENVYKSIIHNSAC
jgi:CDP-glycerol glycerophosphotransferase